jgi:hypothetical protein
MIGWFEAVLEVGFLVVDNGDTRYAHHPPAGLAVHCFLLLGYRICFGLQDACAIDRSRTAQSIIYC